VPARPGIGQKQPVVGLFDHLISQCEEIWRKVEPDRHGRLEVDHQLEFRWLPDWQVGRLCPLQNPVDVIGLKPFRVQKEGLGNPSVRRRRLVSKSGTSPEIDAGP
jgi:hypothetical protein